MDFFFNSTTPLDLGKPADKFRQNVEAIRILKACQAENRPATSEEQAALSLYVGWGDAQILDKLLNDSAFLTDSEFASAKASALNAHFTDLSVIGAMWQGVTHLGINNPMMSIFDPSAGVGHFKSAAPETLRSAEWVEIELDQLTAGMLSLLHPNSHVYAQGYEETYLPDEKFDLAISNVPFGSYGVGFSTQKLPRFVKSSIHDFFFANTVALLRPGGIMAFITSRFTMDKKETAFRRWLAERMDLLAAVRLPCTAFKANAGTEVVTDILFLQKRTVLNAEESSWLVSIPGTLQNEYGYGRYSVTTNEYYQAHPEMVLGKQLASGSMYRGDMYNVEPNEGQESGIALGEAIRNALLSTLPKGAAIRQNEHHADEKVAHAPLIVTSAGARTDEENARLEQLHEIYGTAKHLLASEILGNVSLYEVSLLRDKLNEQYDRFVLQHGLINDSRNERLIRNSAEGPFLLALEIYDSLSKTAEKAGIFTSASVRSMALHENLSSNDALLVCLDHKGKVDIEYIGSLTGLPQDDVITALGESIFPLPYGGWEVADAYLSGNIRDKLNTAKAAAEFDSAFARNVAALEAAIPAPIPAEAIRAPFGAGWIPTGIVEAFCEYLLEVDGFNARYIDGLARWRVETDKAYRIPSALSTGRWGTPRAHALDLIDFGLNAKTPVIYDESNGKRHKNQQETVAAQAKLADIKAEWERWVWDDPDQSAQLADLYNYRFNSWVIRQYDGNHLTTPGLSLDITPRKNQKDSVWRTLQNQATLLDHEVGLGKTLSGIVSAMEAKRLGLIRKAMVVVPNHLVGQWEGAIAQAYPNANAMIASSKAMSKANRPKSLSLMATNEWDLIVIPYSSFKSIPVNEATLKRYFQDEIDKLEDFLYELKSAARSLATPGVIKDIERAKKTFEAKLERLADHKKDNAKTIIWEELGIDMLIVDEFHSFKNLFFPTKMSRIAGLGNSDSQRAFDMFIKSRWVLDKGGKFVGLTGTPVTNTLAELFTMQRYFQMDVLEDLGLTHFDAWANQFALAEPGLEMTPDGAGFRMNVRFRKFVNVPELMRIWYQVCDTKKIDKDSGIERPELYSDGPIKVLTSGGEALHEYTLGLAERADRVRSGLVDKSDDNMLLISNDGRKAALDLSLVVPAKSGSPMPKIDELCRMVSEIYFASEPVKGAQLIFMDLATPKPKAKSAAAFDKAVLTTDMYRVVRERLKLRGVKPADVAFIHDAKNSAARLKLFEAVNKGNIRVLIGSTEKMGTGMNAQERLIALHHVTPPWRPADIAQQLGRMKRFGNRYPMAFQFVHVLEGSFDGYTWQTLENKAGFIDQIGHAGLNAREVDDISETALTYGEIKALASGNPKIMEKVTLESELMRLYAVREAFKTSRRYAESRLRTLRSTENLIRERIAVYEKAIAIRDANTSDGFSIQLVKSSLEDERTTFTDREEAGKHLRSLRAGLLAKLWAGVSDSYPEVGAYKGIPLQARLTRRSSSVEDAEILVYFMVGYETYPVSFGDSDTGITLSLDAKMRKLNDDLETTRERLDISLNDQQAIAGELQRPWEHEERYQELNAQVAALNKELDADNDNVDLAAAFDMSNSASIAESQAFVDAALNAIRAMHQEPEVLARFDVAEGDAAIAMDPRKIAAEMEVQQGQLAQLEFAMLVAEALPVDVEQPVQLDMFGGFATMDQIAKTKRRR